MAVLILILLGSPNLFRPLLIHLSLPFHFPLIKIVYSVLFWPDFDFSLCLRLRVLPSPNIKPIKTTQGTVCLCPCLRNLHDTVIMTWTELYDVRYRL